MSDEFQQGKRPVSALLAGPYGHPFHPILVTVPIGAWVSSVVFDIASHLVAPADAFAKSALWLIGIGILGALAAAMVGFLDLMAIPTGTTAFRTALLHMSVNVAVVILFAIGFAWRLSNGGPHDSTSIAQLVLSIVALLGLTVAGYLGGKLAYHYGVRVADESTQATGFEH